MIKLDGCSSLLSPVAILSAVAATEALASRFGRLFLEGHLLLS